jgi:citrate lyase subunit beta/citryl-CoA lyase
MSAVLDTLALARSFLFVPATRPERYAKALASGADAVIIDLEDAVAPHDKDEARHQLASAFEQLDAPERARTLVRMNASGSHWMEDDLKLVADLVGKGLPAVMLPKCESAHALRLLAQALGANCALFPLVESLAGLDAIDALAAAPQVLRLAFGHLDFQADVGLACDADEVELVPVRLAVVSAARRAGLAAAIDGVTVATQDAAKLQQDLTRSRRSGFGAKMCIHPAQVALVNAAFSPSAAELDWARRVIAAVEVAGGGVVSLDGRMVDGPVVRLAQRTLAQSRQGFF